MKTPIKINLGTRLMAWARGLMRDDAGPAQAMFRPPTMLPGVAPEDVIIAMDNNMAGTYSYLNQSQCGFTTFVGYPTLAELTQLPEYRMLSEKSAQATIRKWIELKSTSDKDNSERIKKIDAVMIKLKVRELFGEVAINDGFFGRCQLFVDLGLQDGPDLKIPMVMDGAVVKGKLRKFKLLEAMYTYPNQYSASNPMRDDYYNPRSWFVMGQEVHSSRLLTFVGRPVPDMLKPSYNFGGLSMSQLAMPYVNNWLRTRNSVGNLISNFSTTGIATNMDGVLAGGEGEDMIQRGELFTAMRDNRGLMMLDKESEEMFQFNVPLTTVDKLQAQSQEQLAAVSNTPISVLLGITPAGLNASSDGEIRIFYDHVADVQRRLFGDNLTRVIQIIQLSEFGDIDPDISYDFIPLWSQTDTELAANRKADAECGRMLIDGGVITPEEMRQKLSKDPDSGYTGLDMAVLPDNDTDEPE